MSAGIFDANKLFHGIDPEVLATLVQVPEPIEYAAEEVILQEGETADFLYLIARGTVRISKEGRGGRQETLTYLESGDFFGEMGLYDRTVRSARATALGPTVLGRVDLEGFEHLLRIAPAEIAANLLRENVVRLRDTDNRFIREVLEAERLSLIGSMVGSIAHDIRSPLAVVLWAADLLPEEPDEKRRERLRSMIRRSIGRISDLTQELLDYSKGTTRLSLEVVNPADLLAELHEELLERLPALGIQVEVSHGYQGELSLDRGRFFRVLANVVKNAVEAMPEGGQLRIAVEEAGADHIQFRVSDSGVGIPAEVLPRIFEPFVSHGKSGGTGLGMAIAKAVVEAHGGRISVESAPGEGASFAIVVPRLGSREPLDAASDPPA